ncbi:hypothetical protein [Streptomyces nigrescens]
MATKTRPMTFDRLISNHAQTIANLTEQPTTTDPGVFVEQVQTAADILSTGMNSTSHDDADTLTYAATYLADALPLDDSDTERAVLLRRANDHLNNIDATDYL